MKMTFARRIRLLLVVILAVLVLFVSMNAGLRLLTERLADNRLFSVLVNDQRLLLDGATLRQFNTDLLRLTEQQRDQTEQQMQQWADQWLDQSFALALAALPDYMDWYYSMPGSYARLYHAVDGDLDVFMQQRMTDFLIEDSGLQQRLAGFDTAMLARWQTLADTQQRVVQRQLTGLYAHRQQSPEAVSAEPVTTLNIDQALGLGWSASAEDLQRWQAGSRASLVVGAGTLGLLLRRSLMPRLMSLGAVQGSRRALAGFVARLAPRLAIAISTGGTAAAVTAPSGPGALVAGSVAFLTAAGTLVVTDFTLLKAEEALLRERKEMEMRGELLATREALRVQLHQQLQGTFNQAQEAFQQSLTQVYDRPDMDRRFHILGP
ncbi:hypothetical protein [Halopseudomonas salina]|uniref:Methyl-accepting chemotaxis protein n=1 Tax=Halopseudomonas salina TaxID=1323744 RepID=A0ABQ1Q1A7_9GAMM|nr:hypothetical protein [Halopseudomonas salina]GGD09557.1 hypothetical protein GCM10007418_30760 [Halopseudomonas salina]